MITNQIKSDFNVTNMKEQKESSKRSKNFKQSEIDVLLDLVHIKKGILECKKTDQITQREKDAAWKEIEVQFNQQSGVFNRDWRALKGKYENIKKVSKKAWASEKKYVRGTGGGPNIPGMITKTDIKIKEILGDLPIKGNVSLYDSDNAGGQNPIELESSLVEDENLGINFVVYDDEEEIDLNVMGKVGVNQNKHMLIYRSSSTPGKDVGTTVKLDTSQSPRQLPAKQSVESDAGFGRKYNVKDLNRSVSSALKVQKNKKSAFETSVAGKKIEVLSKAKLELIELQRKVFQDQQQMQQTEHEIRVKCMLEKHEEEMKLLRLKVNIAEQELRSKQASEK